jgi:hypothetical protein
MRMNPQPGEDAGINIPREIVGAYQHAGSTDRCLVISIRAEGAH